MQQQFAIGDKVQVPAFTDCFGQSVPQTEVLTVTEVRLYWRHVSLAPYFRLTAHTDDGFGYHEGAERFFEAA